MGFSYTAAAGRTLDAIRQAGLKQLESRGEKFSNVFYANGKRYFYEVTRRDQKDGGICGTIQLYIGEDKCRKVGTFKIDGQGRVVRGPSFFKTAAVFIASAGIQKVGSGRAAKRGQP